MARKFLTQIDMGSQKIINLLDPTSAQDAATKAYVDALINGLDWKNSVRAASTVNGTLASAFANGQIIDGVTLATNDAILLKNQTTGADNGIYIVQASGAPVRRSDADGSGEITGGLTVGVEEGTANGDKAFILTNNGAVTIGTTSLTFTQLPGLAASNYQTVQSAGAGITQRPIINFVTGLVATDNSGNTSSDATIDTAVVVRKFAADVGDGSSTSISVTHSLSSKDVAVHVYDKTTPFAEVFPDIQMTSTSAVTLVFAIAPTSAQYRCVVHC